ncbi:MAG: sigma-54-dependent Fis family transcriptional regulator [Deltaproteobacteria bacterium]|nr:sigma-54-dependent Fis family transcriptional regulator [Deltaproteobacteria bacterium]
MIDQPKILIIDDEPLMRISITDAMIAEGYEAKGVESGREGIDCISKGKYDVIITDLKLPEVDGMEIVKASLKYSPKSKVIMITAYGSVDTAVEAMKQGAYDYITKPFSMDELLIVVRRLMEFRELEYENIKLKSEIDIKYAFEGIVSTSDKMQDVLEKVKVIADTASTVLITGESGTGKELIANAIHHNSSRKDNPFIKVSCAALPETLLEAELFGYEKGAFTGALKQKKGRFELAHTGTLFLDEIGEISPAIQVKLLRALQERRFERLGGTETLSVDVRIICATQRDLKTEVKRGIFREDLYYRLNVVPVHIPPLRERKEDILIIANSFAMKFSAQNNKPIQGISDKARELLVNYPFPGNVRELEHAIERAVILGNSREIQPSDLSDDILAFYNKDFKASMKVSYSEPLPEAIEHFEKEYIAKAIEEAHGNKTRAAERLGISRKTLWEKCKNHGLEKQQK